MFAYGMHMHIKLMNTFGNWLITASIIQGSGMDLVTYIRNASDLCPIHQHNMIFKYADSPIQTSLFPTFSPSLYHRNCNIFLTGLSIIT